MIWESTMHGQYPCLHERQKQRAQWAIGCVCAKRRPGMGTILVAGHEAKWCWAEQRAIWSRPVRWRVRWLPNQILLCVEVNRGSLRDCRKARCDDMAALGSQRANWSLPSIAPSLIGQLRYSQGLGHVRRRQAAINDKTGIGMCVSLEEKGGAKTGSAFEGW